MSASSFLMAMKPYLRGKLMKITLVHRVYGITVVYHCDSVEEYHSTMSLVIGGWAVTNLTDWMIVC